ncbi:MAG: LPS export ABC transporter permease LptG [Deltaproteobacteria bacterium]|nr:LPS export ABC transporter permease LptG [Deltaproteobacteria bacterium]
MKILERYILAEFAKLLLISVLSFMVLFIMVDLFENMDNLMKHGVPLFSSVFFFIYKVPFIMVQISPVAVLIAVLLSLGLFSRHGEITAVKAGGVRLLRVLLPLLVSGLLISIAVIIINESVTPAALKKVDAFRQQWFGIQGSAFGKEGMWVRTSRGIFNIRQIDLEKNELRGFTLYEIEKPFNLKRRIHSKVVEWKDGKWVTAGATVWNFNEKGEAAKQEVGAIEVTGLMEPGDLADVENLQKNMGFMELRRYIQGLEADGYDASRYRIDLYGKVAFPLVNFIMVLMGIPFALKTGRHGGIAVGVGLSVVIAFSYWVVFAVTRSLGQTGMIPPMLSAAFPDILFFAVGALMYGYVRQ